MDPVISSFLSKLKVRTGRRKTKGKGQGWGMSVNGTKRGGKKKAKSPDKTKTTYSPFWKYDD